MSRQRIRQLSRQLSPLLMRYGNILVATKPSVKVITIEPCADALSVERVVEFFAVAFEQVCALKVVDRFGVA